LKKSEYDKMIEDVKHFSHFLTNLHKYQDVILSYVEQEYKEDALISDFLKIIKKSKTFP